MEEIDPAIFTVIANVIFLLFLSAVFSGAETAFTNLSAARMEVIKKEKNLMSQLTYKLYKRLDLVIALSLILSNGVNIFLATYLTIFFTSLFGVDLGATLSATIGTVLVIIFGEIFPKKFAILYPVGFSRTVSPLLEVLRLLLFPVIFPIQLLNSLLDRIKKQDLDQERTLMEQEVQATLDMGHVQGALESKEYKMMNQLLLLNDREVKEIMTRRSDIVAISAYKTLRELLELSSENNLSRIPVYKESLDNIDYVIHTFKLNPFLVDPNNLDRPIIEFYNDTALKIPESKILDDLFFEFQERRLHMAIVLDEYGVTSGLITLEDIIEQIFGEIQDETDEEVLPVVAIDDNKVKAQGDATLEEIEEEIEIDFPEKFQKHKTIGWLILHILHRFPKEGEKVKVPNTKLMLEVVDKDGEYIDQVHIHVL
jgi:CBS domain containing-hemolysin-like protein